MASLLQKYQSHGSKRHVSPRSGVPKQEENIDVDNLSLIAANSLAGTQDIAQNISNPDYEHKLPMYPQLGPKNGKELPTKYLESLPSEVYLASQLRDAQFSSLSSENEETAELKSIRGETPSGERLYKGDARKLMNARKPVASMSIMSYADSSKSRMSSSRSQLDLEAIYMKTPKESKPRSNFITPEALKPRLNYEVLQTRVRAINSASSDVATICSVDELSQSYNLRRARSCRSNITFQRMRGAALEEDMTALANRTHRHCNERPSLNVREKWKSHSALMPSSKVKELRLNETVHPYGLAPLTPQSPVLNSSAEARTAIGALVGVTLADRMKGPAREESENSMWHHKMDSDFSDSRNSSRAQDCIKAVDTMKVNFDTDGDYEPLTAVGKLLKGLSL